MLTRIGSKQVKLATRVVAGLTLKNNLSKYYSRLSPQTLQVSKQIVLEGISDPEKMIRNTCGSIITNLVSGGNIQRWPEVLPKLLELLNFKETVHGKSNDTIYL